MGFWVFLWKAVFVLGVGVFAVMAVWVTISGWRDIRELFASIDTAHGKDAGGDD